MNKQRRLGVVRRFSLADVAEGWDDSCYAMYRPASYRDLKAYQDLDTITMKTNDSVAYMVKFIKEHFVSGKVMILDDNNTLVVGDMETQDVDELPPDVLGDLFATMNGGVLDPKDTAKEATPAAVPPSDDPPTATS